MDMSHSRHIAIAACFARAFLPLKCQTVLFEQPRTSQLAHLIWPYANCREDPGTLSEWICRIPAGPDDISSRTLAFRALNYGILPNLDNLVQFVRSCSDTIYS